MAIDTTLCCDIPGIQPEEHVTKFGGGVALKIMDAGTISHRGLLDEFISLADRKKISYQLEVLPLGRTDSAPVQQATRGRETVTLSIPTRYIHTTSETVDANDVQACIDLLAATLAGSFEGV
jgi:endoglucanase